MTPLPSARVLWRGVATGVARARARLARRRASRASEWKKSLNTSRLDPAYPPRRGETERPVAGERLLLL
jgi:hypothetical protein